ncbi:MAG TPA: endonuclease V [Ruminococcus sp.]|nr:endonuclease V [Ruminococcus sp.]
MKDIQTIQTEFLAIQNSLQNRLDCCDRFPISSVKTVAGVDLAYWNRDEKEFAVCCIIVIDCVSHEILEKQHSFGEITVPYIPSFLAFRELPLVLETVRKLTTPPDVYMFDGNGYLHPRHMGIASQASFSLNVPTIGVAKTYFRADGVTECPSVNESAGSTADIIIQGEIWGKVLRTHDNIKPVFVSVGNYISLDSATSFTMSLVGKESRIPIPTRIADLETHILRREYQG